MQRLNRSATHLPPVKAGYVYKLNTSGSIMIMMMMMIIIMIIIIIKNKIKN